MQDETFLIYELLLTVNRTMPYCRWHDNTGNGCLQRRSFIIHDYIRLNLSPLVVLVEEPALSPRARAEVVRICWGGSPLHPPMRTASAVSRPCVPEPQHTARRMGAGRELWVWARTRGTPPAAVVHVARVPPCWKRSGGIAARLRSRPRHHPRRHRICRSRRHYVYSPLYVCPRLYDYFPHPCRRPRPSS